VSEVGHDHQVDHERLVETTARLTKLLEGSSVVRIKASVGPYKWDIEAIGSVAVPDPGGLPRAVPTAIAVEEPAGLPVTAPLVGVFYRAPAPNDPPFVTVGQRVAEGDQIAIVEAMKMMNRVSAPCAGTVREIHCDDGAIVEFGEPLCTIDPE